MISLITLIKSVGVVLVDPLALPVLVVVLVPVVVVDPVVPVEDGVVEPPEVAPLVVDPLEDEEPGVMVTPVALIAMVFKALKSC